MGGASKGYQSPYTKEYENVSRDAIYNRLGAKKKGAAPTQQTPTTPQKPWDPTSRGMPSTMSYNSMRSAAPQNNLNTGPAWLRERNPQNYSGQSSASTPQQTRAPESEWDFSSVGGQVNKNSAIKDYDFSGLNQAMQGLKKTSYSPRTREAYNFQNEEDAANRNAYNYDFAKLPESYGATEYELGAKNMRRDAMGYLDTLGDSYGIRNMGALNKAQENARRGFGENLATLQAGISQDVLRQNIEQARAQQLSQADENYRSDEFNRAKKNSLQQAQADELYRTDAFNDDQRRYYDSNRLNYLNSLSDANMKKIGTEADITGMERDYQDRALEYLLGQYETGSDQSHKNADRSEQSKGRIFSFLGNVAGSAI